MKKNCLIYGLLALLLSCQSQNDVVHLEKKLQKKFNKTLYDVGLKVRDSVYIKENSLYYNIVKDSGYYVDPVTNRLIRGYLLYKHYEDIKALDSVNIQEEYKDLSSETTYYFPKKGIDKIYEKLSKNPLFISLVPYILRNTDANDIVNMDGTINDTPEYVSEEKYNFKGHGFWEFIDEYTLNCCDPKSDMHMNMDEILYASKYPEFPTRPDIFEYVIKESKRYCKKRATAKISFGNVPYYGNVVNWCF